MGKLLLLILVGFLFLGIAGDLFLSLVLGIGGGLIGLIVGAIGVVVGLAGAAVGLVIALLVTAIPLLIIGCLIFGFVRFVSAL